MTTGGEMTNAMLSADEFYSRNSQGLTRLSFHVHPDAIQLDRSPTDFFDLMNLANAKLSALGGQLHPTNYSRVLIYHPQLAWNWAGIAVLGGGWAALNGTMDNSVIIHELGHTFGLLHANAWLGYAWTNELRSEDLYSWEYGDSFDPMGANMYSHFCARSLYALGWLNTNQTAFAIGQSNTYRIYAEPSPEHPDRLLSVLLGPPRTNEQVWVEFNVGFFGDGPGLLFRGAKGPQSQPIAPTGIMVPLETVRQYPSGGNHMLASEIAYSPFERYQMQIVGIATNLEYADVAIRNYSQLPLPPPPLPAADLSTLPYIFVDSYNYLPAAWMTDDYFIPVRLTRSYIYPVSIEVYINNSLYYRIDGTNGVVPWHAERLGTNVLRCDVVNVEGTRTSASYSIIGAQSAYISSHGNNLGYDAQGMSTLITNGQYFIFDRYQAVRSSDFTNWQTIYPPTGSAQFRWWKDRLACFNSTDVLATKDGTTWQHMQLPNRTTSSNQCRCYITGLGFAENAYYVLGSLQTMAPPPSTDPQPGGGMEFDRFHQLERDDLPKLSERRFDILHQRSDSDSG